MQTLDGPNQRRGIFVGAKTGYVVLRIEPRSASRLLRASSAFPTLTGSMPLAARLQAASGPYGRRKRPSKASRSLPRGQVCRRSTRALWAACGQIGPP